MLSMHDLTRAFADHMGLEPLDLVGPRQGHSKEKCALTYVLVEKYKNKTKSQIAGFLDRDRKTVYWRCGRALDYLREPDEDFVNMMVFLVREIDQNQ